MFIQRHFIVFYFCAFLLLGLGYLFILPPFEGFDEPAHYSSIRQIADTQRIPIYGRSYLDQFFIDYKGPVTYGTVGPPFDNGLVYPKFFADTKLTTNYVEEYRHDLMKLHYQQSNELNWEAQHPPLYYLAMAG